MDLHPFAESLERIDLTLGEPVFNSDVEISAGKIGLDRVDYYSSTKGVPVYEDHEYQLVSVYDNTTDRSQDSMAVMLLYMHDKQWKEPPAGSAEAPRGPQGGLPAEDARDAAR